MTCNSAEFPSGRLNHTKSMILAVSELQNWKFHMIQDSNLSKRVVRSIGYLSGFFKKDILGKSNQVSCSV